MAIPPWVQIEEDTLIHPSVVFVPHNSENSYIGKRVRIESGSVIYGGVNLGNDSAVGHNTVIRFGTVIGVHSVVANLCMLEGNITVGDHTLIHSNNHIGQKTTIGHYVFIAPMCVTTNDPKMYFYRKEYSRTGEHWKLLNGPTIKDGARIAVGVIIFPGVTIGSHAVLGAGSIITEDVPDYAVVHGESSQVQRFIDPQEDMIFKCDRHHT
jgi:acetyltransferase-like isoleucine patch superfamily enzyme